METLKVLYVDDHIPTNKNEDLYIVNQDELRRKLKEKNPGWNNENLDEWTSVYYNASLVRQSLEEAYLPNLTLTNHHKEAMRLASKFHYDIAIVDIGWKNDTDLSGDTSTETAGWAICDKIRETDQRLNCNPTLQIAYSSRFVSKSELSGDARDRGVLPFFKTRINAEKDEIDANVAALKAVVKFLAMQLTSRSPEEEFALKAVKDFHNMTVKSFKDAQDQLKRWSIWTLGTLVVSTLILLVGILGAFFWNVQVGLLTSISSIIIDVFSYLFFNQLDKAQKVVDESQHKLIQIYKEAIEKLYTQSMKNT